MSHRTEKFNGALFSKRLSAFASENDENKALYDYILEEHHNAIIEQFGGFSRMIHLCLTNSSLFDDYDNLRYQDQLTSFEQLFLDNGILVNMESKSNLENNADNTIKHDDINEQHIGKQTLKSLELSPIEQWDCI